MSKAAVIGCARISSSDGHFKTKVNRCKMCQRSARPDLLTCSDKCQTRFEIGETARAIRFRAGGGIVPAPEPQPEKPPKRSKRDGVDWDRPIDVLMAEQNLSYSSVTSYKAKFCPRKGRPTKVPTEQANGPLRAAERLAMEVLDA